ncbi:MAG: phosphatidylinositol-specific phospholipase C1-like protein [Pseudohongiellaceae bacterium]
MFISPLCYFHNRLEFLTAHLSRLFVASFLTCPLLVLFSAVPLTATFAQETCPNDRDIERFCRAQIDSFPMNFIQTVGSHNSYKQAIPEAELALIRQYRETSAITLDYSHSTLTDQLNRGMRQIELDILYDPAGGRYADPLLAKQTRGLKGSEKYNSSQMQAPGFKVLHAQDLDVRSSCATWISCLTEIKSWSQKNPSHIPILILFNAKTGGSAYPESLTALPFDSAAFEALDAEIQSVFMAEQLLTPDDVRGDHPTLRDAVLAKGWPSLASSRGKVFFALDEGPEKVKIYSRGNPSLEGLPVFVNSVSEHAEHAAYFTINDPIRDQLRISEMVTRGFIVRTRADANTYEARNNETKRRQAAFDSGAQYISTDYYLPRPDFSDYSVSLKNGIIARCNPILLIEACSRP